jgi:hypothetical protein
MEKFAVWQILEFNNFNFYILTFDLYRFSGFILSQPKGLAAVSLQCNINKTARLLQRAISKIVNIKVLTYYLSPSEWRTVRV